MHHFILYMHLFSLNKFAHLRHCLIPSRCSQPCSLLNFVIIMFITCIYLLVRCGAQKPQHACGGQKTSCRVGFLVALCGLWDKHSGQKALRKLPQLAEPSRLPSCFNSPSHTEIFMMCLLCRYDEHVFFNFNLKVQVAKTHFNRMHILNIHSKK